MMKRIASVIMAGVLVAAMAGCSKNNGNVGKSSAGENNSATPSFSKSRDITVISREDGSGTRGAFIELMGIEAKGADGSKTDKTTKEAIIANKTDVMLTNVANDPYAIGYVSMGSLNDSIKPLEIDGAKPTGENIKNKSYKVARPFNIATKGAPEGVTKDFIDFILSAEGQNVVGKSYIKINDTAPAYAGTKPKGKIVVAGSSSVSPIMEKLKEAYLQVNPNATVEVQMSDSTAGMTGVKEGTCDIGMASRTLKDSEKQSLTSVEIAMDGIAIIVNSKNPLTGLTSGEVNKIFTGEALKWQDIIK